MDQTMYNILITLGKSVPVLIVLLLALRYFLIKEKKYIQKIDELQNELRSNEKENVILLNRFAVVLDKITENQSNDKEDILKEINLLHKDLAKKLSDIKK